MQAFVAKVMGEELLRDAMDERLDSEFYRMAAAMKAAKAHAIPPVGMTCCLKHAQAKAAAMKVGR